MREAAQISNQTVADKYALISSEVMKVPANGEDVLALKKYIAECRDEHDKLILDIEFNKQREDFLYRYAKQSDAGRERRQCEIFRGRLPCAAFQVLKQW